MNRHRPGKPRLLAGKAHRRARKAERRELQRKRADLVHAAGCVFTGCPVRAARLEMLNEAVWIPGLRIPRSIWRGVGL